MDQVTLRWGSGGLGATDLASFFVGWPTPPHAEERVRIVAAADEVVVAHDSSGSVVGFATAITDGRFSAFIPLVEVVPECQGTGIGRRLVEAMLERLSGSLSGSRM